VLYGMALVWFLTPGLAVPMAFALAPGLAALGIVFAALTLPEGGVRVLRVHLLLDPWEVEN